MVEAPQELFLRCDRARVRRVIANLLDNALKYGGSGTAVEARAFRRDGEVVVSVTDQGPGIPPQELPRIWDRLYRGDAARSERGLGLGLSLVKAIVEAHRGRVEVSSSPGAGATFTAYLPIS